jgi:hypothetical protein
MSDEIRQYVDLLRALKGCVLREWFGIEIAICQKPNGKTQWYDESVPGFQFDRLDLKLANGKIGSLFTSYNNGLWGLSLDFGLPIPNITNAFRNNNFRERILTDFPNGEITSVDLYFDAYANISDVQFIINGHTVNIKAGEIQVQELADRCA